MKISALIIIALPLFSFLTITFFGEYLPGKGNWLATACMTVSTLLSFYIFLNTDNETSISLQYHWFTIGGINFNWGISVDRISSIMILLVSFIGLMVHLFSIRYMAEEIHYKRYWKHLGLFCFSMLGLVMSGNILLIYIFWELVGFSSYLLIGFWFNKNSTALAARETFIINRIADMGFLIAILLLFSQFGTLDIQEIKNALKMPMHLDFMQSGTFTVLGLCLFVSAMGKSAQFPFHVWLPDAMEGPTPVSSLIHAATMVAAGVYLLVRLFFLLHADVQVFIAITGSFTAFMAAGIALAQNDIKRVLAFSTVSQLGYMIASVGFNAPQNAMLHLTVHAFFKCLLFLCVGLVIYYLKKTTERSSDEELQDMRLMGGLKNKLTWIHIAYIIAAASMIGIPLFSGFLSKESILHASVHFAMQKPGTAYLPFLLFITLFLTAMYMSRQYFMVFIKKGSPAPPVTIRFGKLMMIPVVVLALFCFFIPFSKNPFHLDSAWILPIMNPPEDMGWIPFLSLFLVLAGIGFNVVRYTKNISFHFPGKAGLHRFFLNQWHLDSFYNRTFVKPVLGMASFIYRFDQWVIDGIVNISGKSVQRFSVILFWMDEHIVDALVKNISGSAILIGRGLRLLQNGKLQFYITLAAIGLLLICFFIWH